MQSLKPQQYTYCSAFCVQHHFQNELIAITDTFQKMDHFYWSLQSWLMYRFDALSAFSTFLLTLVTIYTNVSSGIVAFVLVAAAQRMFQSRRVFSELLSNQCFSCIFHA